MKKPQPLDDSRIRPSADEAFWRNACGPLRSFIADGHPTWTELHGWARRNKVGLLMVRNMLAWLELEHRATGDPKGKRVRKVAR